MWGLRHSHRLTSSYLCGFEVFVWHARFLSQSCDTWTETLTWGQTLPLASLRAPQPLSALYLNSIVTEASCWNVSSKDVLRISLTLRKNRRNSVICGLKAITGNRVSWSGLRSSVPSTRAIFWPRLDVHGLSELQVVSPALVVVPQAWHRLHQTGGQPEWGLMRLKPHQRLAYLSSLQSTCATLSVWWELKLPQNSPSSCNYSNS